MADNDAPNGDDPGPQADPDGGERGGTPRWVKAILLLVVISVAVVVLFTTVFPWVEERTQDPTMGTMLTPWLAYLRF